jgi:hypothetical protein
MASKKAADNGADLGFEEKFWLAAEDKRVGKKVSPDYPEEFAPGEFLMVQITEMGR